MLGSLTVPHLSFAHTPKDKEKAHEWKYLGGTTSPELVRSKRKQCDVVVVGGGMAGICSAVAAARQGAKVILINDRPVLGGNASSEIRVTVNGAQGFKKNFDVNRETGIIEEILLENRIYNPQESYPMWDYVLYDFVVREPNIELMLNTQATRAIVKKNKIQSAVCWQSTSETEIILSAPIFIDCSGDGLLAADAGAEYRTGREGKAEFGEQYAPDEPDGWTMGDSIMMISKEMNYPVKFKAPSYIKKFDGDKAHDRKIKHLKEGFWWVELGSDFDVIAIREKNSHDLKAYFWGVWDYIKNSGKFPQASNLVIDWVGSLPGRRESRRFMGDYILTEKDMLGYKHFSDAIAYGGWSLDEHCPGGILSLDQRPSYFHEHFVRPYEIPFRCIYSKNIENLFFAGRNVSVSHIALSSTRIIGTCCLMGQAAGLAAAMCIEKKVSPRTIGEKHITELQERMLREDYYIPNRPAADAADKARTAQFTASSTLSGNVKNLTDGVARDVIGEEHHWESDGLNATLTLEWNSPVKLSSVELKCNSNLHRKIMMHKDAAKNIGQIFGLPPELVKSLSVEIQKGSTWTEVGVKEENITRYLSFRFPETETSAVRIKLKDTYGSENIKLFEVRCY